MTTDEVTFNDHWAEMLGHSLDDLEPRLGEWKDRVHPKDRNDVEAALEAHIEGETPYYETEHRIRTADGDWKWIRDIGQVVERDDEGESIRAVGIHIDIDEQKRNALALKEERDMFAEGPTVVFRWANEEGWPVEYVSENIEDVLGYTSDEITSEGLLYTQLIHDDDIERVAQEVAEHSESGVARFGHEPYRMIGKEGEEIWVMEHTMNVRNECGEIIHRLGYLVDITERKEYEQRLEEYQTQLEESNERLQQFAYVISHDLQEPLRMVSSYMDLLEDEYSDDLDGEALEYIDYAVDGANRMSRMVDDFLSYSRVETRGQKPEPVDATDVLEETLQALTLQIEEADATVNYEGLPTVLADESQLAQLFQNLLSNAIQYGDEDPPRVEVSAERRNGEVVFAVSDNGIGIPEDEQDEVFQIFTRGRAADRDSGTGIGLAICRRIVERHGGDIWIDSEFGEGSTFYFTFSTGMGESDD